MPADTFVGVDPKKYTAQFNANSHINLQKAFDDTFAQEMTIALEAHQHYTIATYANNQVLNLPSSQYDALSLEQKTQLQQIQYQNAAQGVGYCYKRSSLTTAGAQNQAFNSFSDWLNNEDTLHWVRTLSGHSDIRAASLQASCFEPGHYLTRHNDYHATEARRVAFVANFNKEWHPDWGGLLQFYNNEGLPQQSWAPFYNSLNLFDVSRVHSVTYIAPFARQSRFAFSGWFRATPL